MEEAVHESDREVPQDPRPMPQKVPAVTSAPASFGEALRADTQGGAAASGPGRAREFGTRKRPLQDTSGRITILYSSYLGGAGDDAVLAAAASRSRGIWVAGHTSSDLLDGSRAARKAPGAQAHRRRVAAGAGQDAFIAQIGSGGEVLHVTYIGGSGKDMLCGITDEGADGVWAVGSTTSADLEPPASRGAAQERHSGAADVLLVNVRPGGEVRYLSYLGGTGEDAACAVARGAGGHVWVGGTTQSTDLPTTKGAAEPRRGGGGSDGFLGNVGPEGRLRYLSYVSGQVGSDGMTALLAPALPLEGVWLGGFLTVPFSSPAEAEGGVEIDALVASFNDAGSIQVRAVQGGGGGVDRVAALAADDWDGTVVVCGETTAPDGAEFHVQEQIVDSSAQARHLTAPIGQPSRHADAFVAKLFPNGTVHSSATLGGRKRDASRAVAISAGGTTMWLGGATASEDLHLVATGATGPAAGEAAPAPRSPEHGFELDGRTDGFLAKVDMRDWESGRARQRKRAGDSLRPTGMRYIGGSGNEEVNAIVAAEDGTVWAVGCTDSSDLDVTQDAAQRRSGGRWDGFIARVS